MDNMIKLGKGPKCLGTLFRDIINRKIVEAGYYDDTNESPKLKFQSLDIPKYKNYFLIEFSYENDIESFVVYTHPVSNKSYWYSKQSTLFPNITRGSFDSVLTALEDLEGELYIEFESFIWNNYYEIFE